LFLGLIRLSFLLWEAKMDEEETIDLVRCSAVLQAEQICGQLENLINTFRSLGLNENNQNFKTLEKSQTVLNVISKEGLHTLDYDVNEIDYWLGL
jgi:hypothetical protein